jgi:plasmid maintenance system killer protein
MRIRYNRIAVKAFADLPSEVQRAFLKQVEFLVHILHHLSLRAQKYDEAKDRWQPRVNRNWRFYFTIEGDAYVILDIVPHPR